jgi:hypothetical protein
MSNSMDAVHRIMDAIGRSQIAVKTTIPPPVFKVTTEQPAPGDSPQKIRLKAMVDLSAASSRPVAEVIIPKDFPQLGALSPAEVNALLEYINETPSEGGDIHTRVRAICVLALAERGLIALPPDFRSRIRTPGGREPVFYHPDSARQLNDLFTHYMQQ